MRFTLPLMLSEIEIVSSTLSALSPAPTCPTFDISADRYARGEGFWDPSHQACIKAIQKQNPIRALVREISINA